MTECEGSDSNEIPCRCGFKIDLDFGDWTVGAKGVEEGDGLKRTRRVRSASTAF